MVQKRHHLVVGLDFGTTYTGVAYALSGTQDIYSIEKWPGVDPEHHVNEMQAPSVIAYGDGGKVSWGYQVTPEMKNHYQFLKLHLDKNAPPVTGEKPIIQDKLGEQGFFRLPADKEIEVVTLDYLTEVLKHARAYMEEEFGTFIMEESRIEFWITKSTTSGDEAQQKTTNIAQSAAIRAGFAEEAARRAGFADNGAENFFGLVEESVAALSSNLLETSLYSNEAIEPNSNILVVDCGGGQVDIAVYNVNYDEDKGELQLEQVTVAQGPKVGAADIDRKLHDFIGSKHSEFRTLGPEKAFGSEFMQDFEKNKRRFKGANDPSKKIKLTLKMDGVKKSKYYKENGKIVLTEKNMEWMFKSTIEEIEKSLWEQVKLAKGPIKDLALVGGFGDSPYLQSKLEVWCDQQDIKLRTMDDSWGAVAKGAVAYGLGQAKVTSRLMQSHYGVGCALEYKEGVDEPEEMFTYDGRLLAENCVSWIVPIGSQMSMHSRKIGEFETPIVGSSFDVSVYCSKAKVAPRKATDGANREVQMTVGLSGVDIDKLCRVRDGWKMLPLQVEAVFGERKNSITFRALVDGKVLKAESMNYLVPKKKDT